MIEIQGKDYNNLKGFCFQHGFTFNSIVQFVCHKVLSIYGNSNQTVIGTTVSGRNHPIEGI